METKYVLIYTQKTHCFFFSLTLMRNLEYGPKHLVAPLALVGRVLGVAHLIAELEQRVFNVLKALGRRLAVARGADCRHFLFFLWLFLDFCVCMCM